MVLLLSRRPQLILATRCQARGIRRSKAVEPSADPEPNRRRPHASSVTGRTPGAPPPRGPGGAAMPRKTSSSANNTKENSNSAPGAAPQATSMSSSSLAEKLTRRIASVQDWVPLPIALKSLRDRAARGPPVALFASCSIAPKPGTPPFDGFVELPWYLPGCDRPLRHNVVACVLPEGSDHNGDLARRLRAAGAEIIVSSEEQVRALAVSVNEFASKAKRLKENDSKESLDSEKEAVATSAESNDSVRVDSLLCARDAFPMTVKYAKQLGMCKLMPSVKRGTVADDLLPLVERMKRSTRIVPGPGARSARVRLGGTEMTDGEIYANLAAVVRRALQCGASTQGAPPTPREYLYSVSLSAQGIGAIPIGGADELQQELSLKEGGVSG